MKISDIFVLLALSAIAEAQWAVAARGLYQPVILSIGAIFTAINSMSKSENEVDFVDSDSDRKARTLRDKLYNNPVNNGEWNKLT